MCSILTVSKRNMKGPFQVNEKDLEYFNSVIDMYYNTGENILDTAKQMEISRTKVRKILITMGELESDITDQALKLINEGKTQNEVAELLNLSIATLSTYLPYGNRVYNREEKTPTAIRVEECRARQSRAAMSQVLNSVSDEKSKLSKQVTELSTQGKQEAIMEYFGTFKSKEEYKSKSDFDGEGLKVVKLHMELVGRDGPFDEEEMETLKKYGKVCNSLSRTILVPGSMTLYSLHYAIQRCFGWQNSHLHHFSYDENLFKKVTGGKFGGWKSFCGQYFRFPYDSGDDLEDIYWNDDYEEGQSFKTWLRKKYTGPYYDYGQLEQYFIAKGNARAFAIENKEMRIGPSFSEYLEGKRDSRMVAVDEVTTDEMYMQLECKLDELLERLTVEEVLGLIIDVDAAKKMVADNDKRFDELYVKWYETPEPWKDEYSHKHTAKMLPLSNKVLYEYDYGDGWRVMITCQEIYECFDSWNRPNSTGIALAMTNDPIGDQSVYDSKGVEITGEERERIATVAVNQKPIGLVVDGRNVLDDVGGIYGYCEFLKSIYDKNFDPEDSSGPYTDKESSLEWAKGMGWNGRISKPDKLL